ncbi:hypothetical protein SNEBB_002529 [Seison nebaliae]|nr:hypothetical protein SNEBB_002529 [Seison nebaliae]
MSSQLSTAGAIQVPNPKGGFTMKKVRIKRYFPGKGPESIGDGEEKKGTSLKKIDYENNEKKSIPKKRFEGLNQNYISTFDSVDVRRRLNVEEEKEIDLDNVKEAELNDPRAQRLLRRRVQPQIVEDDDDEDVSSESSSDNDDNSEDETDETDENDSDNRNVKVKPMKSRIRQLNSEVMDNQRKELIESKNNSKDLTLNKSDEEGKLVESSSSSSSSEEEDDSDEDEEEEEEDEEEDSSTNHFYGTNHLKMKPVFIKKSERITLMEKEIEEEKKKNKEKEEKQRIKARMLETRSIVVKIKKEEEEKLTTEKTTLKLNGIEVQCDFLTDDDSDDEASIAAWRERELGRINREREKEMEIERSKIEREELRDMTEEERNRIGFKKVRTNVQKKGKIKFLQKYYHRGAFFLDEEEEIVNRNAMEPTLDDLFDKSTLPQIMQKKNFGKASQTKYTHLTNEDTTKIEKPLFEKSLEKNLTKRFGGGNKDLFVNPNKKRRRI